MEGPPFSVPDDEVRELFSDASLEVLESQDVVERSPFRDQLSRFEITSWSMEFESLNLSPRR